MTSTQIDGLMPVVILMAIALIFFFGAHYLSLLLSTKKPTQLKQTPYECGEEPVGTAWSAFNVRFYVVGFIFFIFDVESVAVLVTGIAYCWKKGDLDWVKSFQISARAKRPTADTAKKATP